MPPIFYARHQFPPMVIQHAVWLYLRFTLSFQDVEDLLTERGLEVSYETVRRWVLKFGPAIARRLRQRRPKPSPRWHLDEVLILSAKSEVLDSPMARTARVAALERCTSAGVYAPHRMAGRVVWSGSGCKARS